VNDLPKKFSFGNEGDGVAATPPPSSPDAPRKPRGFSFPTEAAPPAPEPEPVAVRKPRTFSIPDAPAPAPEPVVERKPRTLAPVSVGEAVYQRNARARTLTDDLIDRAKAQNNAISGEIRGKIDTLLHHTSTDRIVEWGNLNLAPLQQASNIQATIAAELRRINAVEAMTECKEAACRPTTFFDRVTGGKKAEFYEARLGLAKNDLVALMIKAEAQRKSYRPEVHDLLLDAVAMVVTHSAWTDPVMMQLGSSRAKTLLAAHQTGTMLLQTLDNTVSQCGQYVEQIDGLLTNTIPQWKMLQQQQK
jgi:hypothetical protein